MTEAVGRYSKISARFWRDERVQTWSDDQKLLGLYLLTCPHRNAAGYYHLPLEYVVADLGWQARRVKRTFSALVTDGFIAYDERTRIVLVRRALKYDRPANPNQAAAVMSQVRGLPPSPLLEVFLANADLYAPKLGEELRERLGEHGGNGSETVTQTVQGALGERADNAVALSRSRSRNRNRIPQPEPLPNGSPVDNSPAADAATPQVRSQATSTEPEPVSDPEQIRSHIAELKSRADRKPGHA